MKEYYIGLLSGTSVDGIDAGIVEFSDNKIHLLHATTQAFSDDLQQKIQTLIKTQQVNLTQLLEVDSLLAFEFSQTITQLIKQTPIKKTDIVAIGSHGQTVFHQPEGNHPNSLQLGSLHKIAAMTGINVVGNFRQLDMALGGQGAPLAPLIHQKLFAREDKNTAVINLGGIANISLIGKDFNRIIGYDIGPANCLIDEWIHIHQQLPFDRNGDWARTGQLNQTLLAQMLEDDYFSKPAPKSTGREYFNYRWYDNFIEQFQQSSAVDIQTTLSHLVAATIHQEIAQHRVDNIIITGGGAKNNFIMELIQQYCHIDTKPSDDFGYDADGIEILLFAYLAYQRIHQQKLNLSSITASRHALLVGDIVRVR